MLIKTKEDFKKALESGPYAWPGGYPLYFIMGDGEAMSFEAVRENADRIERQLCDPVPDLDWLPVALEVNWEDQDLLCAHTFERIPSAYGGDTD